MRSVTSLALALLILPLVAADKPAGSMDMPPVVGAVAPDFTLKTPEGEAVTLSKLMSQSPVVLIVLRGWPGYQCPICTKQVGQFVAKSKEIEKTGATVLLVYPGPSEELKAHAEEFRTGKNLPANFHFVIDPDYVVTNQYHLRWNEKNETAYPSTFILDKSRTVQYAHTSHTHADRTTPETVLEELAKLK
jgi:peroxiredoxin